MDYILKIILMKNKFEKLPFNETLVSQISERNKNASNRIAKRVRDFFVPHIEDVPPTIFGEQWRRLRRDFFDICRNPKSLIGKGVIWDEAHEDWSREEIGELYFVLFGENIPDTWKS